MSPPGLRVGIRAFELAVRYAQQRAPSASRSPSTRPSPSSSPRWPPRSKAAHLMMVNAARLKDSGDRNDVAAGMAKIPGQRVLLGGLAELPHPRWIRLPKEYEIERLMRDAPFLLIGEGTSEIRRASSASGCWRTTGSDMSAPEFTPRPQLAEDVARLVRRRIFNGTYPAGRVHPPGPARRGTRHQCDAGAGGAVPAAARACWTSCRGAGSWCCRSPTATSPTFPICRPMSVASWRRGRR